MTREELDRLTKIRDDAKGSFWDFEKWHVMAAFDQFISDAAHALNGVTAISSDAASDAATRRPPSDSPASIREMCAKVADRFHLALTQTARAQLSDGLLKEASISESRALTALGIAGTIRALGTGGRGEE